MPKALQIQRVFMLWESSIKLSKSGIIQSLDVNLRYLWVPKHCKKKTSVTMSSHPEIMSQAKIIL